MSLIYQVLWPPRIGLGTHPGQQGKDGLVPAARQARAGGGLGGDMAFSAVSAVFIYRVLLFRGNGKQEERVMKLHSSDDTWGEGRRGHPFQERQSNEEEKGVCEH